PGVLASMRTPYRRSPGSRCIDGAGCRVAGDPWAGANGTDFRIWKPARGSGLRNSLVPIPQATGVPNRSGNPISLHRKDFVTRECGTASERVLGNGNRCAFSDTGSPRPFRHADPDTRPREAPQP